MKAIRAEILLEMRARLESAPRGERAEILQEYARFLGVSVPTAYRELKNFGYARDRKRRSDRGKTCVDRELALKVAGLVRKGTRANGRRALKMNTVVDILEQDGFALWWTPTRARRSCPTRPRFPGP